GSRRFRARRLGGGQAREEAPLPAPSLARRSARRRSAAPRQAALFLAAIGATTSVHSRESGNPGATVRDSGSPLSRGRAGVARIPRNRDTSSIACGTNVAHRAFPRAGLAL